MIYFVCMVAGGRYKLNLRLFGALAFQTVLGCCMGCALLVPAALSLVQNPRTIDPFNGYGYLVYGSAQQYLAIFTALFDAGCPLPERPVPGGHLKAHQHDRLPAGGGHCGRAGVLPRAAAPPLCTHHESVPYLRLCAGAEQHVLCPQFQLLCALVLYAGFGALRRHGYDAAKSQPVRNRVPPRAGPCGAVYLEQHCLCAGAQ